MPVVCDVLLKLKTTEVLRRSALSGERCAATQASQGRSRPQRYPACRRSGRQHLEPRNPAARPGEAAVLFLGPCEDDARRRSGKRHEIVCRPADAALGGRQADEFAVVAAEPGIGAGHLRPAAFVQPGQHHHIRRKQACIQRLPYIKMRGCGLSDAFARLDAITCAKNSAYSARLSAKERAAACSSAVSAELSACKSPRLARCESALRCAASQSGRGACPAMAMSGASASITCDARLRADPIRPRRSASSPGAALRPMRLHAPPATRPPERPRARKAATSAARHPDRRSRPRARAGPHPCLAPAAGVRPSSSGLPRAAQDTMRAARLSGAAGIRQCIGGKFRP